MAARELLKLPTEKCRQNGAYGSQWRTLSEFHHDQETCKFAGNFKGIEGLHLVSYLF
jgi:hypothetical protein